MGRILLSAALSCVLVGIGGVAPAQTGKEAEGRAAEQAGRLREALTHYVAALQTVPEGGADDQRLRETIITLVQKLSPPPAIPEEARRFAVRGQTWIKDGRSVSDFDEAAREYARATRLAPWWANAYFDQAIALEKAGKFAQAIRALKLYLLAAPAGPDADKVRDQIYALEVKQERAAKEAGVQEARERAQEIVRSLAGTWEANIPTFAQLRYTATVQGQSIEMTATSFFDDYNKAWRPLITPGEVPAFRGTINGSTVSGTASIDYSARYEGGRVFTGPFSGTISSDGKHIQMNLTLARPCCGWRFGGPGTRTGDKGRGGGFQDSPHAARFIQR